MTKVEYEQWVRTRFAEAFVADPVRATDAAVAATGREIFVWSNLSTAQLRALGRLVFSICIESRG